MSRLWGNKDGLGYGLAKEDERGIVKEYIRSASFWIHCSIAPSPLSASVSLCKMRVTDEEPASRLGVPCLRGGRGERPVKGQLEARHWQSRGARRASLALHTLR